MWVLTSVPRDSSRGCVEATVAVDVGGTFTDVVVLAEGAGVLRLKVLTTPHDPSAGVVEGVRKALKALKDALNPQASVKIRVLLHATTVGTNAFLGQSGLSIPKVGMLTTEGFRDVIEIGRQRRPELYNPFFERPKPLVPRKLRLTVKERVGPGGRVIEPLDEDGVREAAEVFRREGAEAVAVCFLHSYVNPAHEARAAEILRQALPGTAVVASYEVDPMYREFERFSTAVVNAALKPLLSRYFETLSRRLKEVAGSPSLLIMKSDGGYLGAPDACRIPASTIESGPAAGVSGAAALARELGLSRVLSFDMGGTTAKVAAVVGGEPEITEEFEVGGRTHRGRLVKGSGYVVRYPHIDLVEVSAGGGTIAWVDDGGHLRVGPLSAGSAPGPACYGRGGENPTVTDANLLLGRLGRVLAGGEVVLDAGLALRAMRSKVCVRTGLSVDEASYGTIRLANAEMCRAIKIATLERGYDPRDFTLVAFGGAGPMHACELASELGIREVLIPPVPGVFSAYGMLKTGYRVEVRVSVLKPLRSLSGEALADVFKSLEARALHTLLKHGVSSGSVRVSWYADVRYSRQSFELRVRLPRTPTGLREALLDSFTRRHEEVYGYSSSDDVVVVNARVAASAPPPAGDCGAVWSPPRQASGRPRPASVRRAFFPRCGWVDTPVFIRSSLPTGWVVEGPAVIEEYGSATLVPPDWLCEVLEPGVLRLRLVGG